MSCNLFYPTNIEPCAESITLDLGLTASTLYRVQIMSKFGDYYNQMITSDGDGKIVIDTDTFPTPYGFFKVADNYFTVEFYIGTTLQSFTISEKVYSSVVITLVIGAGDIVDDTTSTGDCCATPQEFQEPTQCCVDGKSAYEVAVANGFIGTEAEWLLSLKGEDGAGGVSQSYVDDADAVLQSQIDNISTVISSQNTELIDHESRIGTLETNINDVVNKVSSLENDGQNIIPSGVRDGVNTTFKLPHTFVPGTLKLYNGIRQIPGIDYNENVTFNGFEMTYPPLADSPLITDSVKQL